MPTYVVPKGKSLDQIARELGYPDRTAIQNANKGVTIRAGMTIRLPYRRPAGRESLAPYQGTVTRQPVTGLTTNPQPEPSRDDPSAKAAIRQVLDGYGLGALADWAWNAYLGGTPQEQIALDMRNRPEYKQRFQGIDTLRQKGRAISESAWIAYEQQAVALMRARGIPTGFYDQPSDLAKFITNEVSVKELDDRLELAQQAALSSPPEVRDELSRLYGIGAGELTAFWLDPDKALPVIQRKFTSAQLASESARTGFGQLGQTEAERLAAIGVDPTQAGDTFSTLAGMGELTATMGGEENLTRDDLLSAGFENNANARQRVERKARTRAAAFAGGGGFAEGRSGIAGLGSATT